MKRRKPPATQADLVAASHTAMAIVETYAVDPDKAARMMAELPNDWFRGFVVHALVQLSASLLAVVREQGIDVVKSKPEPEIPAAFRRDDPADDDGIWLGQLSD
jgi:hypothetical protein